MIQGEESSESVEEEKGIGRLKIGEEQGGVDIGKAV
jgi:hypothetical protein